MSALRTADVTARVVNWHNRHPLARRIAPGQVSGIGIVALPFALKAPLEPADRSAVPFEMVPLFGAGWMFHAAPKRLDTWVRRHGVYPLPGATHWPLRQIDADLALARDADARGLEGRTVRHLVTAVIDVAGQRVRVLLAPQESMRSAALFGSRVYSLPRASALAGASAALGMALGTALGLLPGLHGGTPQDVPAPTLAAASAPQAAPAASGVVGNPESGASAASAAPVTAVAQAVRMAPGADPASAPRVATPPPAASATPPPAASAPVLAVATAPPEIVEPADVAPELRKLAPGTAPLVRIRPALTEEERRQARLRSASLRPVSAGPAAKPKDPVYAIVTPGLRTRVDAEAQQVLLQGLMVQTASRLPTRLEVMATQGRWRVVWWPHPQQQQAEQLVLAARARGLKVELISF